MATSDKIENKLDFIIQSIGEVETNLTKRIDELCSRITNTERGIVKLDRKVPDATALANGKNFELNKLKDTVAQQRKAISTLERDFDDFQGRIRRKTLIFRGIPEGLEKPGGWEHCKELILQFLRNHFSISYNVEIEPAYRSSSHIKPHLTGPRPIIVAFLRWKDANHILSLLLEYFVKTPFSWRWRYQTVVKRRDKPKLRGLNKAEERSRPTYILIRCTAPKLHFLDRRHNRKRKSSKKKIRVGLLHKNTRQGSLSRIMKMIDIICIDGVPKGMVPLSRPNQFLYISGGKYARQLFNSN